MALVLGVLLMALSFAHGAIQWLAADAVGVSYNVTGLSFQPKALAFWWQGLGSATDTTSQTTHSRRGVGFATSPSDRRCVATQDQDAAGTMVCTTGIRADAVVATVTSTPAIDGLLDLDSIAADGFRVIVDDQAPVNLTVFWCAWGGDDLLAAATGEISEPAAVGAQNYVVTGSFQPSVLLLAGVQATDTPSASRNDSGLYVGYAAGGSANGTANNWVVVGNNDDASTTADCDGYCQLGECLAMIAVAGGNPNARAGLNQFNADGFQLGWAARATTNRRSIYLAIHGGKWQVGDYTLAGDTVGSSATVNGLSFAPLGLLLSGHGNPLNTVATSNVNDVLSIGCGVSPSDRMAMGHRSEDNSTTASSVCEIDLAIEYDQVLVFPSAAGALKSAYDIDAVSSNGFRIIVDLGGGSANEVQGYLTFGSEPAGIYPPQITLSTRRAP